MKIVPLSSDEAARTGYTHVINFKVANGDLAVIATTTNVMPLPIGMAIQRAAIDVRTLFATITTPSLSLGHGNSGASATQIFNAQVLTAATFVTVNLTTVVLAASQFVTATQNGTVANATAGECNVYLYMVDLTLGRNTFAP